MAKFVGVVLSESDRIVPKLRVLLVASAGLVFLASFADPADAAQRRSRSLSSYFYGYSGYNGYSGYTGATSRGSRQAVGANRAEPKKDPGFGEMPKGPLQIIVSIGSQKVTLYSNGQRVATGPVSTGVPGHSTPMGVFSIIEKDRHHHSNIYSGAPMPFMQRITWSGVALHEGALPGHPASHGCIRMSHDFAQKLWPVTKLGVRVIVARGDVCAGRIRACQAVHAEAEARRLVGRRRGRPDPARAGQDRDRRRRHRHRRDTDTDGRRRDAG